MAILRQVAFVPSPVECQAIADLKGPIKVWQLPKVYGNLPQTCFLQDGSGTWFEIRSKCEDIEFKFECLAPMIQRLPEEPDHIASASMHMLQAQDLRVVFRAEWQRPAGSDQAMDEWNRLTNSLSLVEDLPTRQFSGCLSWTGLLFRSSESYEGLIYLDDFPLSIGFTTSQVEIQNYLSRSKVVHPPSLTQWIEQLRGWEVRLME